jgi:CBS domain containing-hemolysin-like protein
MQNLHLYTALEVDELAWPDDSASCTLDSPASKFMVDFRQIKPIVYDATTSADELKSFMLHSHIHTISVLDSQSHFAGIVSLGELSDQALIRKQAEGFFRKEIKVSDVMIKRRDLPAFDAEEIQRATIGDVVSAIKKSGCRFALVLDRQTHQIQGIFSADELSERLQRPIEIRDESSFYRVFAPVSPYSQRIR